MEKSENIKSIEDMEINLRNGITDGSEDSAELPGNETKNVLEQNAPVVNIPHVGASLLMTVKSAFDADIYIDMLKQYDIAAIYEKTDPTTRNPADPNPSAVNIFVQEPQLDRAKKLVDAFENKPIEYHTPPPRLNQVSKVNRFVYGVFMFFLLVVPLGAALIYLIYRIVKFITQTL